MHALTEGLSPALPMTLAGERARHRRLARMMALPAVLYATATAIYAWAALQVPFAANEGSAYYVAVARNLVTGRGLVTDALWSFGTPPLTVPRPAFELWQPLATFVSAAPMTVLGPTLTAAQLGMAALAGLLAPLGWLVAREAATALGHDQRRSAMLAAGTGLLLAVAGPLVLAASLPDSTIPFAVAGTACCWLIARSLAVQPAKRTQLWLALGLMLGLAWLARHEAIWIALVALGVGLGTRSLTPRALAAAVAGGLLVSGPWLLRNLAAFGSPLPGQALDNAMLTANEQIFGYRHVPSLDAFLGQGPAALLGNVAAAAWHNAFSVLLVPAAPLAIAGLVGGAVLLWHEPSLRRGALALLLLSGLAIYAITTVLFPVATLWGTFEHASGPLVVGLAVAAVLGVDRAVQAIGRRRRWENSNAWLAPLALTALTLPLTLLLLAGLASEARQQAARYDRLADALHAVPRLLDGAGPLLTDHPVWLSDATGLPAAALPAEEPSAVGELAGRLGAWVVVLTGERGSYPAELESLGGRRCFEVRKVPGAPAGVVVASLLAECRSPW
ncbi:MAG TPA: hypothetical protein VNT28_05540 [Candidatus Limnocylindrales bacterium]|jgi:hypothetical protein|nr:hypothetical protein [Candidatus Limnocylindrales bacterium]